MRFVAFVTILCSGIGVALFGIRAWLKHTAEHVKRVVPRRFTGSRADLADIATLPHEDAMHIFDEALGATPIQKEDN